MREVKRATIATAIVALSLTLPVGRAFAEDGKGSGNGSGNGSGGNGTEVLGEDCKYAVPQCSPPTTQPNNDDNDNGNENEDRRRRARGFDDNRGGRTDVLPNRIVAPAAPKAKTVPVSRGDVVRFTGAGFAAGGLGLVVLVRRRRLPRLPR